MQKPTSFSVCLTCGKQFSVLINDNSQVFYRLLAFALMERNVEIFCANTL